MISNKKLDYVVAELFVRNRKLIGVRCAIWYHLCSLKNVKNTHGGVLILVKINTPPWVFFTYFKLYKLYQIVQRTTVIVFFHYIHNSLYQMM